MGIGRFVLALSCAGLAVALARAQDFFFDEDFGEIVMISGGMVMGPGGPATPAAGPNETPTERGNRLKALEYDRRPSTILRVWSTPPPVEKEEEQPGAPSGADAPAPSEGAAAGAPSAETEAEAPAAEETVSVEGVATGVELEPEIEETPEQREAREKAEEEARKAKEAADAAAAAAAEEAARKAAEAKAIEREMAAMQRNVTLGDWQAVKAYLATLTSTDAKLGYERMLQSLQQGPQQRPNVPPQGQAFVEKNQFSPADVVGLASAAPAEITPEQIDLLGKILRQALDAGHQVEALLMALRPRLDEEGFALGRRRLALVLVAANEPLALEELVPSVEEAEAQDDREGLNLISRHCLARYAQEKKSLWLTEAWRATRAVLAAGEVDEKAKAEALTRAVELAPKIEAEHGKAWLDESFTERPERGREILATIGSATSTKLAAEPMDADSRKRMLELQATAARALLAASPELADAWRAELSLLASNWLREAQHSYQHDDSTSIGPRQQRDVYGNIFYFDWGYQRMSHIPSPLRTKDVLDLRPTEGWLERVDPTLRPRLDVIVAQLYLKASEEAEAFPYIESVAAVYPRLSKSLVDDFLRVWAKNHDPNSDRNRTNAYMYFYGFEQRASGIPLTRSKQERNLAELERWVARLRELPVELDARLLAEAFTKAHSTAEVYRLETIERIFGGFEKLDPATLAELVQSMRANLASLWRDPAVQRDKKTGRNQKDIEAEVLRGYELAGTTLSRALAEHPSSWELRLGRAALAHDQNQFQRELASDADYSARRAAAFEDFQAAAELYREAVPALEADKHSTRVYELWFYAALGACDLALLDPKMPLAAAEVRKIRSALEALPGEASQAHIAMFASTLFARMSNVKPAVKYRYVREGLVITGEHELARDARAVLDYYDDLVTEIQLRARIDGSDRVGHGTPFGLAVDIRHTREIERESGGFSKYLQNQNQQRFSWNYGRPTEDYRDKFEEAARETLGEHFEILSVTFNEPEARSKADREYGWRVTPYAYILLRARGPQVDRVPPLRLDLDFLDISGYAILPVESPAVAIDAREEAGEARPFELLALTQILDERRAKEGKLVLEVKASGRGLVPALDELLEVVPEGFDVAKTEDQGASVVRFDEGGEAVVSERIFQVELRAKEGLATPPDSFRFGEPLVAASTLERFRYEDADLVPAEPLAKLEQRYAEPSRAWMWWLLLLVPGALAVRWLARRLSAPKAEHRARFPVPDPLTPFSVIGLLRDIERHDGLASQERSALGSDIATLERHFFALADGPEPDLRALAERWAARAS